MCVQQDSVGADVSVGSVPTQEWRREGLPAELVRFQHCRRAADGAAAQQRECCNSSHLLVTYHKTYYIPAIESPLLGRRIVYSHRPRRLGCTYWSYIS